MVAVGSGQTIKEVDFGNQVSSVKINPEFVSTPPTSARVGQAYRYDFRAIDRNSDALTYSLVDPPAGMLLSQTDRVTALVWRPSSTQVGSQTITVKVVDSSGAETLQSFLVNVEPNLEPTDREIPQVQVSIPQQPVIVGGTVNLSVTATDNEEVASLALFVNKEPVSLDANGKTSIVFNQVGTVEILAIARDKSNNSVERREFLQVVSSAPTSTDLTFPEVILSLPDVNTFDSITDIRGTVNDSNLSYYRFLIAPEGTTNFQEILRGTDNITDGSLGKIDPSTIQNGIYTFRLEAVDISGNIATTESTIRIDSPLKLGNFQLSFTDLSIPLAGIPISVTRSYDSLNSNQRDDFGYGWRLEFRDTDLRTSIGKDEGYEQFGFPSKAFKDGTKVFITLPGGKRETFTFKPVRDSSVPPLPIFDGIDPNVYLPSFQSEKGVTNLLTVSNVRLQRAGNTDKWLQFGTGTLYNPSLPYFGNKYILTTKEGIVYEIDGTTGDLNKVTNPNGNTLTFTDAGITSDTGKAVTFQRDASGRITSVTDPLGQVVKYQYDAKGDLIGVSDRENNTTQFKYAQPTRDHFLTEVVDPLGRSGVKNEYDAQGRLVKLGTCDLIKYQI